LGFIRDKLRYIRDKLRLLTHFFRPFPQKTPEMRHFGRKLADGAGGCPDWWLRASRRTCRAGGRPDPNQLILSERSGRKTRQRHVPDGTGLKMSGLAGKMAK